jgi:hypothetical protein
MIKVPMTVDDNVSLRKTLPINRVSKIWIDIDAKTIYFESKRAVPKVGKTQTEKTSQQCWVEPDSERMQQVEERSHAPSLAAKFS